jgi:hypothetical protein
VQENIFSIVELDKEDFIPGKIKRILYSFAILFRV